MRYIDVRVRIPVTKMGTFIEDTLPAWATMVGYDRLEGQPERKRKTRANGEYTPGKGTAAEAILKALRKEPLRRFELIDKLSRTQKDKAVSSALHGLALKGIIVKNKAGSYEEA
jgi:hypothetical protein